MNGNHPGRSAARRDRRERFAETEEISRHDSSAAAPGRHRAALPAVYLAEEDVPEYRSDGWEVSNPEWVGSTNELRSHEIVVRDENKVAFLIQAARYFADGRLMQTYDAIFTVANQDGDWRLIGRNPFNVRNS